MRVRLSSRLGFFLSFQVLAESEQMRKEADDVGPKAELDHWKKRMAKFNSLLDQIKGTECKAVVGVLHAAKSKLLKVCGILSNILPHFADLLHMIQEPIYCLSYQSVN